MPTGVKKRKESKPKPRERSAFRGAVWRGIGIVLPPLMTIVIFLWIGSTVQYYVLEPVSVGTRNALAWMTADIRDEWNSPELFPPGVNDPPARITSGGQKYVLLKDDRYIPAEVHEALRRSLGDQGVPGTASGAYQKWVEIRYLRPYIAIPVFGAMFVVVMYLLGTFLAAGIGRVFWNLFEQGVNRLPLVRNVYSSVKQVTDFMLNETDVEYSRVVAIEYPREGIWTLGLVTNEGMAEVSEVVGEPVLSVVIPASPMPVTGYTVMVPASSAIDVDITIDQALEFVISCGVVTPPQQDLTTPSLRGDTVLKRHAPTTVGAASAATRPPAASSADNR